MANVAMSRLLEIEVPCAGRTAPFTERHGGMQLEESIRSRRPYLDRLHGCRWHLPCDFSSCTVGGIARSSCNLAGRKLLQLKDLLQTRAGHRQG